MSDRLRQRTAKPGAASRLDEGERDDDEIDPGVLTQVAAAGQRFDRIPRKLGMAWISSAHADADTTATLITLQSQGSPLTHGAPFAPIGNVAHAARRMET